MMRKANVMINVLFFLGVLLILFGFFLFVPENSRTPVAWLNFGVSVFIYICFFGRYSLLYASLADFADNAPLLSIYWKSYYIYTLVSIGSMFAFHSWEIPFRYQLLWHVVYLFLFMLALAYGFWLVGWHQRATKMDKGTMSKIREIQQATKDMRILISELSAEYFEAKEIFAALADDIECIPGSGSEQANSYESEILISLKNVQNSLLTQQHPDALFETLKKLHVIVKLRKQIV